MHVIYSLVVRPYCTADVGSAVGMIMSYMSVTLCITALWLNDTSYNKPTTKMSEQVNRKCPSKENFYKPSTATPTMSPQNHHPKISKLV